MASSSVTSDASYRSFEPAGAFCADEDVVTAYSRRTYLRAVKALSSAGPRADAYARVLSARQARRVVARARALARRGLREKAADDVVLYSTCRDTAVVGASLLMKRLEAALRAQGPEAAASFLCGQHVSAKPHRRWAKASPAIEEAFRDHGDALRTARALAAMLRPKTQAAWTTTFCGFMRFIQNLSAKSATKRRPRRDGG